MKTIQEIKQIIKETFSDKVNKSKTIATNSKDEDNVKYFSISYGQFVLESVILCIINDRIHSVNGSISIYSINKINEDLSK